MSDRTDEQIIEESVSESRDTGRRKVLVGLTGAGLIFFSILAISGILLYHSLHEGASKGADLAQSVQAACNDRPALKQAPQLRRLCSDANQVIKDSPVAPSSPGPTGPTGAAGPGGPGPTNSQVALAVASFCADNGCVGPRGPSPSSAQVAQAVTLYCNSNGQCKGPQGQQGAPGDNATGAPGAVGAQGPPPTDDQIASAVQTYCDNHGQCQGAKGDQGPQGPSGVVAVDSAGCAPADGQVIASVSATYAADTQTITLTCTYANAVIVPGNPGNGG